MKGVEFMKQLTTVGVDGDNKGRGLNAFGGLFLGQPWGLRKAPAVAAAGAG